MSHAYMPGYYPKYPTFLQGWCPHAGAHCATFNPCADIGFQEAVFFGAGTCQYVNHGVPAGENDPTWIRYSMIPQNGWRNGIFWPTSYKADNSEYTPIGVHYIAGPGGGVATLHVIYGTHIDSSSDELLVETNPGNPALGIPPTYDTAPDICTIVLTDSGGNVTMDEKFPLSDQSPYLPTDEVQVKPPTISFTPTYPAGSDGMVYWWKGYGTLAYANEATFRLDMLADGSVDPTSPWYMKGFTWFGKKGTGAYIDIRFEGVQYDLTQGPLFADTVILFTSYFLPPPP